MATKVRYMSNSADIKAQRSRFPLNHRVLGSYQHGYLYPVSVVEVLPGDTMKCKVNFLTRMSTPIFPIMDNIYQHYAAFFVPKRIIFDKAKQFYGEAEDFGIATTISEPTTTNVACVAKRSTLTSNADFSKFASAFDLVYTADTTISTGLDPINLLPVRAFLSVYNTHFRDENLCPSYLWDKSQTGNGSTRVFATLSGSNVTGSSFLPKVCKDKDLFVSTLPWAQKGDPVSISLTGTAPITGNGKFNSSEILGNIYAAGPIGFSDGYDTSVLLQNVTGVTSGTPNSNVQATYEDGSGMPPLTNLQYDHGLGFHGADQTVNVSLSGASVEIASAVTINQLKYAVAYQDFLTRLGHFGSRYGEYIKAMFGVQIADASNDIPEFLGHASTRINIDQVLQTTGHEAGDTSELGQIGANSVTGAAPYLFTKSFDEPGYLVIVTYFKHDRTYSNGINPIFLKKDLLDYYQTPFANIGDMPISKANIFWTGKNNSESFGFQEPWFDYRSIPDKVRGALNPSNPNSLNFMTLAEDYENAPILGKDFVEEDRTALARALTTGINGIDYINDTYIQIEATRVMPLFSTGKIGVM